MALSGGHLKTCLVRIAFALVAIAQIMPSGIAVAGDTDTFSLVICTKDGSKVVDLSDIGGIGLPIEAPDDETSHLECFSCLSNCRVLLDQPPEFATRYSLSGGLDPTLTPEPDAKLVVENIRPPMPSRAPPLN